MKKFLTTFLVLMTVLCGILGLAACGETETSNSDHTVHEWGAWSIVREATCKDDGLRERSCACGEKDTEPIPADPAKHVFDEGVVTAQATCSAEGEKLFTCTVCKTTKTESLPIEENAHEWDNGQVTTAATCTTPGVKTFHCAHDNSHTKTETIEIDKNAHEWDNGQVTTAATCTTPGVKTFHCAHDDSHTKTESIEIVQDAHSWDDGQVTTPATCTKEGVKTFHCQYNDSHTRTETIEIDKDAHTWDNGQVTTPATCTTPGVKTVKCTSCQQTQTQTIEINKEAHLWDSGQVTTDATCMKEGVKTFHCQYDNSHTRTEEIEIDEDAHLWDDGQVTTAATCTTPGVMTFHCRYNESHATRTEEIEINEDAHIWDPANSYTDNNGYHSLVCQLNPSHKRQEACIYLENPVAATCESGGYTEYTCKYCNYSYKSQETSRPLGHNWDDGLIVAAQGLPGKHIILCANDPTHQKEADCEYEITVVEPGCETRGYTTKYCPKCSDFVETDIKVAKGHAWGNWESIPGMNEHIRRCGNDSNHTQSASCSFEPFVTRPTCTTDGFTTYRCKDCPNEYIDDHEDALGHTYRSPEHMQGTANAGSKHKQECQVCGNIEETACNFADQEISALSCMQDGVLRHTCLVCNYHYDDTTPHPGHLWSSYISDGAGKHTRRCNREECSQTQTVNCEFNDELIPATCTGNSYTLRTCKEATCGYQIQVENPESALGHDWESAKAKFTVKEGKSHEITCGNGCGETKVMACELDGGSVTDPTCTAKGYTTFTCEKCHATYKENETEMSAHKYGDWSPVSGYAAGNAKHEHFCVDCRHREEEACSVFSSHTTDPTCYAAGKTVTTCDSCRGEQTEVLDKTEHTWGTYQSKGNEGHYRICQVQECREQETTQAHVMKDGKDLPTCEGKGNSYKLCEFCGHVQDEDGDDIPALGHDYNGQPWHYDANDPGHHYRECKVCQYKDSAPCVINTVTQDATCMQPERKTHTCTECNNVTTETGVALGCEYVYTDNNNGTHNRACIRGEACDNPETAKLMQCNYTSVDTDATCTDDAYTTKTCQECSYQVVETKQQTAKGHRYGSECTTQNDGTHTRRCSVCSTVTLENCEYDAGTVTAPKCTERGYTTYQCTKCRYTKQEDFTDQSGHSWSNTYTSNRNGKHYRTCNVCRATETPTDCSYNKTEFAATCTSEPYTHYECKLCSYTRTETTGKKLEHQWTVKTPATEQIHGRSHLLICTACSTTKTELCAEDLETTPASCTAPERHKHTCRVCKSVYEHDEGEKLEHRWNISQNSLSNTHTKTCSSCGTAISEDCTGTKTSVKEPTCTESGWTVYTCTTCQGTYTADPTPAKGHPYFFKLWYESTNGETHYRKCPDCGLEESGQCVYETVRETKPTCLTPGSAYKKCAKCNRTKTETLSALGHDYPEGEWKPSGDGTTHYRLCRREGCEYRNAKQCTMALFGNSDVYCQAPGLVGMACKECGYMNNAAQRPVQHSWSAWTNDGAGHHSRYCTRVGCGTTQTADCSFEITHTSLTCTTPEANTSFCNTCKFSKVEIINPSQGHSWVLQDSVNDTNHNAQCEVCHMTVSGPHDFEDSNICSVCKYDGLNYTVDVSQTYCIVENDNRVSNAEHIVIPEKHAVSAELILPVKAVGKYAFVSNSNLQTVVLPRCITVIMECAFSNCKNLTSVTFADSADDDPIKLEELGYGAFGQSKKLQEFPLEKLVNLKKIDGNCFNDCKELKLFVSATSSILDSVESIGTGAFKNSGIYLDWEKGTENALFIGKHLIRLRQSYSANNGAYTIPTGTLSVGANAFENCTGLKSLTIPADTKYFDVDAFKGCSALTKVVYSGDLNKWFAIQFKNDLASPLHFASEFNITGIVDNPTFPENVTAIPAGTFRNNTTLKTITIPDSVKSIGARAFEGCVNLATIVLPDTVTYIGEDAFKGCTALEAIEENHDANGGFYIGHHLISVDNSKIPDDGNFVMRSNTVTISPNAFKNCDRLKTITIPDSVRWIGASAFSGCQNFTSVTFEGNPSFFATHFLGVGRWLDGDIIQGTAGAQNLKTNYPSEWKRVN